MVGCVSLPRDSNGDLTKEACEGSGGEWLYVADCPSACEPPEPTAENCETIGEMACMTVCAEVPNCHCPSDKPFWDDGCVGAEACSEY